MDRGEFLVKHSVDDDLRGVNITFNILPLFCHKICFLYSSVEDNKSAKHEVEAYLPGVPRLGMHGALPTNLVHPYLITLSVASMAVNDRMIGK